MRNLKKYLAVLLTVAMLVTGMAPAFADTAATLSADAQSCKQLGMLVGQDDTGVTPAYVATTPSRIQAAVMFLRLKGLEATAKAFAGTENFSDVSADWMKPYTAYLKANPDLGFEGIGDNKFDPDTKITAQQYYKVALTALGYKQDVDFPYSEVLTFAAGKGLSKVASVSTFTVDNLATATVEALKATVKGSSETLAAKLIAAGAFSVEAAVYAGVYTQAAPTAAPKGFELTNKAKTITVKFNYTPADAAKVAVTVTRDAGIAVSATFVQDATDKTVFTFLSSANLVAGDYKVAVKDDTTDLGFKTVKVETEKIKAIEVTSKQIIRESKVKGYAYFKVTNQYDEDVTKMPIASNITWNCSLGTSTNTEFSADKGKLTFVKGLESDNTYMSQLKDFTTTPIVVTAYDRDSAVTYTKTLTVSSSIGDIQSIKLLGISNKDGKTTIYRNNNVDEFFVDYEIKDSNGDLITNYDILRKALRIYPQVGRAEATGDGAQDDDSINIAAIRVKQDATDLNKAVFKIELKALSSDDLKNPYTGVGTQPINFVSLETGKSGQINVEVKDDTAQLESFVLQRPSVEVTAGMGFVEVPYLATDSNGNNITQASKIKGFLDISANSNEFREETLADGTYKLYVDFGDTKDTIKTFQATVKRTYKYSSITVTVKEVASPKSLSSLPFDLYMTHGASTDKGFNDIKVLDKYDNTMDIKNYNTQDGKSYFVVGEVPSDKSNVFSVSGAAYGTKKVVVTAGPKAGTADVKFYLVQKAKDYPVAALAADVKADTTNYKIIDTRSVTFYNVDPSDIVDFTMEAITFPVYVNPAFSDYANASAAAKEYKQEIKVKGLLTNGTKVKVPGIDTVNSTPVVGVVNGSYGIADIAKFAIDGKYVYAPYLPAYESSAKSQATALVRGNDGVVKQVKTGITSSNATPTATAINVKIADPETTNNGIESTKVVKKTDIYYEIKDEDFTLAFATKYMHKYTAAGTSQTTAGLWFEIKDQYDKAVLIPTISIVSQSNEAGAAIANYSIVNGELTGTPTVGDSIVITVSRDAQAKTITLKIVD